MLVPPRCDENVCGSLTTVTTSSYFVTHQKPGPPASLWKWIGASWRSTRKAVVRDAADEVSGSCKLDVGEPHGTK